MDLRDRRRPLAALAVLLVVVAVASAALALLQLREEVRVDGRSCGHVGGVAVRGPTAGGEPTASGAFDARCRAVAREASRPAVVAGAVTVLALVGFVTTFVAASRAREAAPLPTIADEPADHARG